MRGSKALLATAALIAGMGIARADVFTYKVAFSGGNGEVMFTMPGFNPANGKLTKAVVTIDGIMSGSIVGGEYGLNPTTAPEYVYFSPEMNLNGQYSKHTVAVGRHSGVYMPYADTYQTPGFSVAASIDQQPGFFTRGAMLMDLLFGAWVHDSATGALRDVSSADWQLAGTATAYFTYTPVTHSGDPAGDPPADPVPEPGSLALLGTGLAGLGFVVSRRRNQAGGGTIG